MQATDSGAVLIPPHLREALDILTERATFHRQESARAQEGIIGILSTLIPAGKTLADYEDVGDARGRIVALEPRALKGQGQGAPLPPFNAHTERIAPALPSWQDADHATSVAPTRDFDDALPAA